MDQRTKDVIVIPCIIAAVFGVIFMLWGARLAGVELHAPFSLAWFKAVFAAPVPLWSLFLLGVLAAFCLWKGYFYWRRNAYLESEAKKSGDWQTVAEVLKGHKKRLEERVEELESKNPRLHGVWNNTQAFWHMGRHGNEPMTQIGGWIDLTSANTEDNLFILAAYIDGRRSDTFIDVEVKPNVLNREMVMLFFHPPLATVEGEPFEATVTVEDQFNRKYELPRQSFRGTPGPPPAILRPANTPQLHLAWRFAGWCWTDVDEVMITGDGTLVLDNVKDDVMITGVKVDGAEVMNMFDGFTLKPSEPYFRGISVKFKGVKPEDDVPLKAKLTFVDLRGNEYPVEEHEFRLLEHPERFGGIPF